MMHVRRILPTIALGMLLWATPWFAKGLSAQGGVAFPHGTFPEGVGCLDCHTNEGWRPLSADPAFHHAEITGFPLLGRHAEASCRSCHVDLHFERASAAPQECGTCHADVHGGSLSTNCSLCHTPTAFRDVPGVQIHLNAGFPLEGAHLQITCESCHSTDEGGSFSPPSPECLACHREDFEAPKTVDHVALGFPAECLTCHTPQSWMDIGAFDHASFSGGFRLQGAHDHLQCNACHVPGGGLRFDPSGPEDCATCHQADYQREHSGSGYPQTCTLCHNQGSWDRGDFDHPQASGGYELAGAHAALACTSCHTPDGSGTLFTPSTPDDCVACHQADFQEEHGGSGYPDTCLDCHALDTWAGATLDHSALSGGFALPADHDGLVCTSCHTPDGSGTLFTPSTPDDCVACHQADYQREHTGSGFSTDCTLCHTTTGWPGATADHAVISGGFDLLGNHGLLPCTSCHTPDGTGILFDPSTPDDCLACHLGDFQRGHADSGYPTSCLTCHAVTTWDGAQFNHDGDFFPIYSGKHQGRWSSCQTCHTTPSDFRVFSCFTCHEHNKTDTDHDHSQVSGYVYESGQCLSCHPTGNS